ncbi:MAG: hypothetical protein NC320_09180 [Clostridium sp.]|nr:hypothetical protein [Clostridium sp.]
MKRYDFKDPNDFKILERMAYDCTLDIDNFPPAAYGISTSLELFMRNSSITVFRLKRRSCVNEVFTRSIRTRSKYLTNAKPSIPHIRKRYINRNCL